MRVEARGCACTCVGRLGSGRPQRSHSLKSGRSVLLATLLTTLLITLAALTCLAAPSAQAASAGWPQYTSPTDTHETNSAWYPFTNTGGTAVGSSQNWVSNAATDLTNELNVGLGIANYGTTDVFYCDSTGQLLMQAWDFTTVPNAPTSPSASVSVVPAQAGVGYLGVCEVGGAQPDVIVFYVKGSPTVAANLTTLYWVQISEDWSTEHSVAMPSNFLAGASWDQVPNAGATYYMHGAVVPLNNMFAFVSMNTTNAGEVDTYVSNLVAPGTTGAVNQLTTWTPTSASGQQVRDIDAIPFTYQGSTYLALGSLYGTPTTNYDSHWGTLIKQWTSMQAAVRVCTVGSTGSCTVNSSTSFDVPACPDPGPHNNGSGLAMQSGAMNLRLVRGGVSSGPQGDVLTVMTRTFGTLNRWLLSERTSVENHYNTIQPELLDAYEVGVDHSTTTPALSSSPQRYSGWQRRGLMSDGSNDLYQATTVYQLIDADGLVARNFFLTTLAVDDPNGPSNPSSITPSPTPSPSSSASPSPSPSPLVYDSKRQKIVWVTATHLDAHGVNPKNLDDLNDDWGVVGAVGFLSSDALQPVKTDTTDQNGNPLATPISYPYPIKSDTTDLQLIGIIYGTPPTSLNGNAQSVIFPNSNGNLPNFYSSVLFSQDTTNGTTTVDTTEGGAGIALDMEGEGEHGLKFPFQPEISWNTDREDTASNSLTLGTNQGYWPGPNTSPAPAGVAICKQIANFELQRYARRDWNGGDIGNGVQESVFVTNPSSNPTNGYTTEPFSLTKPGADPSFDPLFAGMASRFDTFSWLDWYGTTDLLQKAQQGGHGDLFNSSGGGTEAILSRTTNPQGFSTVSFVQNQGSQSDTVSNGVSAKLKIPFFSGDFSYTHKVLDTTTTTTKTVVSLGLPQPPQGQEAGQLESITVEAYWFKANDTQAYWIPTAFRTAGNSQTPWCIDYQVTAYQTYPGSPQTSAEGADAGGQDSATQDAGAGAEEGAAQDAATQDAATQDAAAAPQCRVAVRCTPWQGGSASVLNAKRAANGALLGTADSGGTLISATPAPGFRFAGWKLSGAKIAKIVGAHKRTARVVASANGGITATAQFARILPASISIARVNSGVCDLRISNAALTDRFAALKPYLNGSAAARAHELKLGIATNRYRVPAAAWRTHGTGNNATYVATWRPSGWNRAARVRLTVTPHSNRWSIDIQRGSLAPALLGAAAGQLPVSLQGNQVPAYSHLPVACMATFKAAETRAAGAGKSGGSAKAAKRPAVDLSKATISTVVDPRHAAKASLLLTGVRVQRSLLRRAGFELAINQNGLRVGPFTKHGGTFVGTSKLKQGVRIDCSYTVSGVLSVRLSGGDLERHLLREALGQNLTLIIGSGKSAVSGTMVPRAVSITRARVAPRLAPLSK